MSVPPRPLATLALVALVALVALLGAGCGGGSSADEGASPSAGPAAAPTASKTVRFAACMRESGVPDFPDVNAAASDQELVEAIEALDTASPAWKQAMAACKHLQPAGLLGAKPTPQEKSARMQFAECIREHGVKDFPDPVDGEPLVDTNRIPSANRAGGMDVLNAAMDECKAIGAKAIGEQ